MRSSTVLKVMNQLKAAKGLRAKYYILENNFLEQVLRTHPEWPQRFDAHPLGGCGKAKRPVAEFIWEKSWQSAFIASGVILGTGAGFVADKTTKQENSKWSRRGAMLGGTLFFAKMYPITSATAGAVAGYKYYKGR